MAYDGNNITDLDPSLPAPVALTVPEPTNEWDDAIREIKRVMLTEFPNLDGPVTANQKELNSIIDRILRSGDQMTGQLTAAADPVDDLDFATKGWVEGLFAVPPTNPADDYPYGFINFDEVPRQPLTTNTKYTTPNTVGELPVKWVVRLFCVQEEFGYKVDDVIIISNIQSSDTQDNANFGGIQPWANTTEIGVTTGSRIWTIDKRPEFTGKFRQLTPFRWEIQMSAATIGESIALPVAIWSDFGNATPVLLDTPTQYYRFVENQTNNGNALGRVGVVNNITTTLTWQCDFKQLNVQYHAQPGITTPSNKLVRLNIDLTNGAQQRIVDDDNIVLASGVIDQGDGWYRIYITVDMAGESTGAAMSFFGQFAGGPPLFNQTWNFIDGREVGEVRNPSFYEGAFAYP